MNIKSKMTQKTSQEIEKISGKKLTLGLLIAAIRQTDNKLQVDFAKILGMKKQQLCDIERGRKSISPKLAAEYAEVLGYSKEQFIRLALQDALDREGLDVIVEITPKRHRTRSSNRNVHNGLHL
ncbi:MAG: helix-turn-helix domain-containing protein [Gammaproteobacteria bacterium]